MKTSLIVLAAGIGSRYGSLKQLDQFGPSGERILDYTVHDAVNAGFDKIIFVIRSSIEKEFKAMFMQKLQSKIEVDYVFQELNILPQGFTVPNNRVKPWGTAHAVMIARSKIDGPFALVNADDFYGRTSIEAVYNHLQKMDNSRIGACLVGFKLENTLSENGRVSRGICEVEHGMLKRITERTDIYSIPDGGAYFKEGAEKILLSGNETVSMNLMGFSSQVFDLIEDMFIRFLKREDLTHTEFYIPSVLEEVRLLGEEVPVLQSEDQWFGVTYQEDKKIVSQQLKKLVSKGVYPDSLWSRKSK